MSFNAGKCIALTITNKTVPVHFDYKIGDSILERVSHNPYLGVEITDKLDWSKHINKQSAKATKTLNLLRRNLSGFSQDTKNKGYKSLVRPTLEYASAVWDPYQANHIQKIESVQRKAARFVTGQYQWTTSVTSLLSTLNWRSLQERRLIARMALFYKAIRQDAALQLHPFTAHKPVPDPDSFVGHNQQYSVPYARVDSYLYSYIPRTTRVWNILPKATVEAPSLDCFKSRIQQDFINGTLHVVPPRGTVRPRLGSSLRCSAVGGPVY